MHIIGMETDASRKSMQIRARTRGLALPITNFVLGCGLSGIAWIWIRGDQSLANNFVADAGSLADQISDRMVRDVGERYAATYMRWTGSKGNTLEKWGLFTNRWIKHNQDGIIAWCPRVQKDNWEEFEELALAAYPDSGGVRIYRGVEGGVEYLDQNNFDQSSGASLWPILYTNPFTERLIGFDIGSVPTRVGSFHTMLATNETTISVLPSSDETTQPLFIVFQPVYGRDDRVVGCTIKFTRVQSLIWDILQKMQFHERYRGADVAVFLQVEKGDSNHYLLFDLDGYPNGTGEQFLQEEVTPSEVERRGSESFFSFVRLTADKAIVVVASFNPRVNNRTSMFWLAGGCGVWFLVALLICGRQVQVLSYKDGMEKATVTSIFKSRFVADMSHEIRTPLNGIIGTVELLAEERLSPNADELVTTVQSCSNILMGIVNDALDFSKIEVGELRMEANEASLRDIFSEVMTVMRSAYGLPRTGATGVMRLRLKVAKNVPREKILADDGRVRQVLCNLISNALKFTDAGSVTVVAWCELIPQDAVNEGPLGEMTMIMTNSKAFILDRQSMLRSFLRRIGLSDASDGDTPAADAHELAPHQTWGEILWRWISWLRLAHTKEGKAPPTSPAFLRSLDALRCRRAMLHVEVTDTGIGMTPNQIKRLFKPFSQVHANSDRSVGGTGLGLAISRSLCESMGGTLRCSSTPGVGSTFHFSVLIGVFNDVPSEASLVGDGESKRNLTGGDIPAAIDPATGKDLACVEARSLELCIDQEWDLIEESGKKKEPRVGQLKPVARVNGELRCDESRRQAKLAQQYGQDTSVDTDSNRTGRHDRRQNGELLHQALVHDASETTGGAPEVREDGSTTATSDDIWFAAVASAREEHIKKESNRQNSPPPQQQDRPHRPRLLIVDDVRVNRMLLRKMLEALDVNVELADNGENAVKACRTMSFTMILMDLMMPVMSGFEAAGTIRSQDGGLNRQTPIIAITASPTLLGPAESGAAGITDVLVTPLTRKALFSMVALYATDPEVERMTAAWVQHTAVQKGSRKPPPGKPRASPSGQSNDISIVGHRSSSSSGELLGWTKKG